MEEKRSGLVLSGINYGENDKILSVFTLEEGIITAKIKGVKKAGAKLKFASEPFCFAEFIFSVSGEKRTVIGASLIDSFYPVREDIVKYFCAGTVVEFIKRFYRENMVSPDLFLCAVSALKEIAYGDLCSKNATVVFLLSALKIVGYGLNTEGCFKCGNEVGERVFFDYGSGCFFCENCFDGNGREINRATFIALKKAVNDEKLSETECCLSLRLLDYYITNKAEEKINSLKEIVKISN